MQNAHMPLTVRTVHLLLASAMLLTACGGGGGDRSGGGGSDNARTTDVPESAQQSVAGLVAFLGELISSRTDMTSEAILVGDATLPTSDTAEATPAN